MEFSYDLAVINLWFITILWTIFGTYAVFEALPMVIRNRRAWRRWRQDSDVIKALETRGDYRRSRALFIGWTLAMFVGFFSLLRLFLIGPPPTLNTSVTSSILTYILVVMLFAFWRAKHADHVTSRDIERYINAHPELFGDEVRSR